MTELLYPALPIMMIDDEPITLESLEMVLNTGGINNIVQCQDSREVMNILSNNDVGGILLDLLMPNISGERLLLSIKDKHPEIPVIIISGVNELETAVSCMKMGAYDYLVKPLDEGRVLATVTRAIEFRELKEKAGLVKQLQQEMGQRRKMEIEILKAEDRIKREICQYIHDDLGAHLALVKGNVEMLIQQLESLQFENIETADKIKKLLRDAMEKCRNISTQVFPVNINEIGLTEALNNMVLYTNNNNQNIECSFDCKIAAVPIEQNIALQLYYIAQEAITNSIKHSSASKLEVSFFKNNGVMDLIIVDNGSGFDKNKDMADGIGLKIMRYRNDLIGGNLDISSSDSGTRVSCSISSALIDN
ncbi:MAG: response regulator [bacterium]|nr:response regulator [bacterium]